MLYAEEMSLGLWMVFTVFGVYVCSLSYKPSTRELGRIARSLH